MHTHGLILIYRTVCTHAWNDYIQNYVHTWTDLTYSTVRSKTLHVFCSPLSSMPFTVVYRGTAFEVSGQNLQLPDDMVVGAVVGK